MQRLHIVQSSSVKKVSKKGGRGKGEEKGEPMFFRWICGITLLTNRSGKFQIGYEKRSINFLGGRRGEKQKDEGVDGEEGVPLHY